MKKKIKEYICTKIADILFDGVFSEIQEDLKNNMQEQIIQQFQDKLDEQMLARYGNSDFYEDLCKAMIKNDNISILLKRCQNRSLLDDREDSEMIDGIMRGMNIRIYNYDNVKDAINYIVQMVLLLWFFLDMIGFNLGNKCLVTRSYKEDGTIFLGYVN